MKTIRGLWLLAGVAGILLLPPPAFAEKDIKARISAEKARQEELAKKADSLNSEVTGLKSKLVETSRTVRNIEENIFTIDGRLKNLREKKDEYTARLYTAQAALGGLVTGAQKYRRASTPELLLQSTPIDAARAALIMKSMIPELDKQSESLKSQLEEITKIEEAILKEQATHSKELSNLNKQQKSLEELVEERRELYRQTESERKAQEQQVERLAKQAKNLEDLVSKIEPKKAKTASTYRLPANTPLPVSGTIRTGFGETDDLGGKSRGVTFSTRGGATVVTPLAGKVKFAGAFQKFRQILIIEHAGGYHSLIAGLGRIDTVVGARLAAGEPVGSAEQSSSGARIYYELRQNGHPVNPQKLLVAQRRQDKS